MLQNVGTAKMSLVAGISILAACWPSTANEAFLRAADPPTIQAAPTGAAAAGVPDAEPATTSPTDRPARRDRGWGTDPRDDGFEPLDEFFENLDRNGDDRIDREEFRRGMNSLYRYRGH